MSTVPPFSHPQLEAITKALGHTTIGLTGMEIGNVLAQCHVADPEPGGTKWKRLFNALAVHQNQKGSANLNPPGFSGDLVS